MTLISLKATQAGVFWSDAQACELRLRENLIWRLTPANLGHPPPVTDNLTPFAPCNASFTIQRKLGFLCPCDSHLVPLIGSRFFLSQLSVKIIQSVISASEEFGAVAPWRSFIVGVVNQLCNFGQRQRIALLQGMLKSLLKPT